MLHREHGPKVTWGLPLGFKTPGYSNEVSSRLVVAAEL
jgi:hypothetical protein